MSKTRDWGRAITDDTDVCPIHVTDDDTGPTVIPSRLVCVTGDDLGKTFRLGNGPSVIGRGDVEFQLTSHDVSRRHAEIAVHAGVCVLDDLQSVNGTYVNGTRIAGPTNLQLGDRIQIGNAMLIYSHFDELEVRMQQSQRVEAMAALAGGLAHDFRNALTVIVAGLDAFEELFPLGALELRETAKDMRSATTDATGLANRLLNLGRRESTEVYKKVALADLIAEIVGMARHVLGKGIQVTCDVPPTIAVQGSAEELHQVFMNLLANSKDAMPNGGTISITAEVIDLERAASLALYLPSKGAHVALKLQDDGSGMDEDTVARVFEPFFTTKPVGAGTGLGLSVVHAITKRHGGSIFVDSIKGAGTTFRLYLPVASSDSQPKPRTAPVTRGHDPRAVKPPTR